MKFKTKELVIISLGISIMIVGGFIVYGLLKIYPIPGFKYAILGPLTGMFLYIIQNMINTKHSLLKIVIPFSILMGIINIYMLFILVPTAVISEIVIFLIKDGKFKYQLSSVVFTFSATTIAIFLAKYALNVIPYGVSDWLLGCLSLLSLVLSVLGIILGDICLKKIKRSD